MRVLFTCASEYGHLHSQLPLARALVSAGHECAFALPGSFHSRAEKAGFPAVAVGLDRVGVAREVERRFPEWATVPPEERLRFVLTNIGARITAPAMVGGLVSAIREWGADVLVHGPPVFAGPIAAAVTGIPSVNHSWGPLFDLGELAHAADAAAPLWEEWSLTPPPFGGMFRYLYLDVCPPVLQSPDIAAVDVAHLLRPIPADAVGDETLPPWVDELPPVPTVYVSMGTFYNRFTRVFATVLEGLRDIGANVVVTVGYDQDPAVLGPQPSHVHVAGYIPVSLLLRHCQAVVSHGGSATVLAALSHGLPQLLLPHGHDQLQNAERCAASGVGRVLRSDELSPEAVRRDVVALFDAPAYRQAAARVQRQIADMPSPDDVVPLLTRLARDGEPLDHRHQLG